MLAVGYYLDRHVIDEINALHRALVFVLPVLVESGHSVVEVGGVGESYLVGGSHVVVFGLRVGYAGQYTVLHARAAELDGARKLRSLVPSLDDACVVEQMVVIVGVRILDVLGELAAGHLHVEVRALEMQSEHGAVGLGHELLRRIGCRLDHRHRRGGKRGENGGRAVVHVSADGRVEGFLRALHKVAPATAVHMDIDAAGHYVAALGVEGARALDVELVVADLYYLVAVDNDRPAFHPALRGKYPSVQYLC